MALPKNNEDEFEFEFDEDWRYQKIEIEDTVAFGDLLYDSEKLGAYWENEY